MHDLGFKIQKPESGLLLSEKPFLGIILYGEKSSMKSKNTAIQRHKTQTREEILGFLPIFIILVFIKKI